MLLQQNNSFFVKLCIKNKGFISNLIHNTTDRLFFMLQQSIRIGGQAHHKPLSFFLLLD